MEPKVKIEFDTLKEILKSYNNTWTEHPSFYKVEPIKGRKIYIIKGKSCNRVDISNFEVPDEIGKVPKSGPFARVKRQLRFDGGIDKVLERFEELLKILNSQEPDNNSRKNHLGSFFKEQLKLVVSN